MHSRLSLQGMVLTTTNACITSMEKLNIPKPHKNQKLILRQKKRNNVICCGRRFGKTKLLTYLIMMAALNGKKVGFFAPAYKYVMPVWRELYARLSPAIETKNEMDKFMKLASGGEIELWSINKNPDAGRSREYDEVFVDECTLIRGLEGAWNESIRPTLFKSRGSAWFTATPKGKDFFKALFDRGQSSKRDDWMSWQMSSLRNPHMPVYEILEYKRDMPQRTFQQEVMAKFLEDNAALFSGDNFYDELPEGPYTELMGLDFAYSGGKKSDYNVMVVGRLYRDGTIYLTDMVRMQSKASAFFPHVVDANVRRMGAYVSGTEAGVLDLAREAYGLRIKNMPATKSKASRAQIAINLWEKGKIRVPNKAEWADTLLNELHTFTGNDKLDDNDDIPDAIASMTAIMPRGGKPKHSRMHSV